MDMLMSQSKSGIPNTWTLLDSQFTVDPFSNAKLLVNIRVVDANLKIHCNVGNVTMNVMDDLSGYGPVWLYENGIANILSLFLVVQRFHAQYDNRSSGYMQV